MKIKFIYVLDIQKYMKYKREYIYRNHNHHFTLLIPSFG